MIVDVHNFPVLQIIIHQYTSNSCNKETGDLADMHARSLRPRAYV